MMQYTNKPNHPYGQGLGQLGALEALEAQLPMQRQPNGQQTYYQEGQEAMRQQSASKASEPIPGTLRGLMARAESLRKMSEATALHVIDIRVALIGHSIAEENSGIGKPAAVPNSHLEAISDIFDHIEARLRVADASLEEIWAKVS